MDILTFSEHADFTADGTSDGYITVADNSTFLVGALVWINASDQEPTNCIVTDQSSDGTSIGLRFITSFINYGRSDCSAFLVANSATIDMEEQLVPEPAFLSDDVPSGVTPGYYTSANITVNAYGIVTAAANGSGGGGGSGITSLNTDVTTPLNSSGATVATIAANAVTLGKMAKLAANSLIGNNTSSSANAIALTITQVNTLLGTTYGNTAGTVAQGNDSRLSDQRDASSINGVDVTGAGVPSSGQILIATGSTAATWQPQSALSISHHTLTNLTTNDDHSQYLYLAGRSPNQTMSGSYVLASSATLQGSQVDNGTGLNDMTNGILVNGDIIFPARGYQFTYITGTKAAQPNGADAISIQAANGADATITQVGTIGGDIFLFGGGGGDAGHGNLGGDGGTLHLGGGNGVNGGAMLFEPGLGTTAAANGFIEMFGNVSVLSQSNSTAPTSGSLTIAGTVSAHGYVIDPGATTPTSGQALTYNGSAFVPTTIASSTGANPTASLGLTAVNGSASTFMRSDAAPALSVGISPTWSGTHTFDAGGIKVNNAANTFATTLASAATAARTWTIPDASDTATGLAATQTLTNKTISGASNTLSSIGNSSLSNSSIIVTGGTGLGVSGSPVSLGGTVTLSNTGVTSIVAGTNVTISGATGAVTISASGGGGSGANPTGTIGLSAVNGSSTSFLRSDGAPALSQAITPTWSGTHLFEASTLTLNNAANTFATTLATAATAARTWTFPDASDTAVGLAATQTLTNKTLTNPVLNGWTGTGSSNFDLTGSTGLLLANSITLENTINQIKFQAPVTGHQMIISATSPSGSTSTCFLPDVGSSDTFVFNSLAATLANKTISGGSNTLSNIANSSLTNSSITVTGGTGLGVSGSPVSLGGTVTLSNTGVTSIVAGTNVTVSGATGAVTISATGGGGGSSANPSASIGLSAVDGTATTFMTSDSAPALSQAISPTWSGTHTFSNTIGGSISGNAATATTSSGLTSATTTVGVAAATAPSSGQVLTATSSTTAIWSAPAAGTAGNPSASIGLTAINGSATTYMRSDGAPALSQAIAPTWTGVHVFQAGKLSFDNAANTFATTFATAATAARTITFPDITSTVATLGSTQTFTGGNTFTGAITQNTGAVSLTGNAASSFTTSSGALTITSAAAATWKTTAGLLTLNGFGGYAITGAAASTITTTSSTLSIDATTTLNLGTSTATTVTIGRASETINIGASGTTINVGGGTASFGVTGGISMTGLGGDVITSSAGTFRYDAHTTLNLGTSTATAVTIGNASSTTTSLGGSAGHITTVADVAYTGLATDDIIAYTSLTATRIVTLPLGVAGQMWIIKDASGSATALVKIQVQGVSGNIDGTSSLSISSAYGVLRVYSNGTNFFSW